MYTDQVEEKQQSDHEAESVAKPRIMETELEDARELIFSGGDKMHKEVQKTNINCSEVIYLP